MIACLKCVVVHCCEYCEPQKQQRVVVLSKLLLECSRCSLSKGTSAEEDNPSLEELLVRVSGPDYSFYTKHDPIKKAAASRTFLFAEESDDDDDSEELGNENLENPFLHKRAKSTAFSQNLLPDQQRIQFEEEDLPSRVMLVWKCLYCAAKGCTGSMKGVSSFNTQLYDCLHAFHGASKIKAHGAETSGLDIVEWWVMHLLLTLLFPVSLAYEFHLHYKPQDLDKFESLNIGRMLLFAVSVGLLVYFLCGLKLVAEQARDPFGEDPQDIPMSKMAMSFCKDIDVMGKKIRLFD
jgi:hypothetical protein